jgi:hypothetical protein
MILDDTIAVAVLHLVSQAAGGRAGVQVPRHDIASLTPIDPAVVFTAIDELIKAGMLCLGSTDDRVSISRAGLACTSGHL